MNVYLNGFMKRVLTIILILGGLTSVSAEESQQRNHKLSDTEKEFLKKQFVELPNKVITAENFQGVPVNDALPELYNYQNRFILLNFWATWCVPCLREMPDMERLHQELGKEGLVVLAVGMGEDKQRVKRFLKKHDFTFPILADPDMEISQLYGVQNLPVTFLIDQDKTVIGRAVGPRKWDSLDLVEFFRKKIKVPQ